MNRLATRTLTALGVYVATFASAALAVDGIVLIDQNRALAGNVTPGDAAGFPVTITQPGSYRLSGNLVVPNSDTHAIVVASSHVTIDLNGFAILGPTDCSGNVLNCAGVGRGIGISTPNADPEREPPPPPQFNITIRNGTIQGMGTAAIMLFGDSHLVEYVHARSNGEEGIAIWSSADQGGSIVQNSLAQRNGGRGIVLSRGIVRNNELDVNVHGIGQGVGTASNNVITRNLMVGMSIGTGVSYFQNVLRGNGVHIQNGTNMGQNLCDDAPCPGAHF